MSKSSKSVKTHTLVDMGIRLTVVNILFTPYSPPAQSSPHPAATLILARLSPWNYHRIAPIRIPNLSLIINLFSLLLINWQINYSWRYGDSAYGRKLLFAPSSPPAQSTPHPCGAFNLARLSP
jgi:hypothetical protein